MLTLVTDVQAALDRVVTDHLRGFTLRNFVRLGENGHRPRVLVDDPADPQVLLLLAGANVMVYGAIHRLNHVMHDLLKGNIEGQDEWPDAGMRKDYERLTGGRRHLFLNTAPYAAWRACILAGFEPDPEDLPGQVAYQWHWEGAPRNEHLVRHSCRVTSGQELFEPMKQAVHYDPEGGYIRQCLDHGPSFVCEVNGEPVCWSCTHLNGTMGMIYTPERHRRRGYARSLAAFQLDYMLGRDGLACCHVIDHNIASMNMVQNLSGTCIPEPLVWREVWWPGEAPPPPAAVTESKSDTES